MSRLIRMTLSVLLLATVALAPAAARTRRQKAEDSWDNLKKLRVGEEIQVVYGQEQYLNGRFRGFTREGIMVQWGVVNKHDETIAREDVIRVIASRPSQRVKNTLIGVAVGAAGGGLLGMAAANENYLHETIRKEDLQYLEIGASIGAALGGVVGALSSPDATIYQAQQQDVRVEREARLTAEPSPAGSSDRSWDNLRTLRILQAIRVLDQDQRAHEGKFLSVSEEAISLDAGQGEVTLARADVLQVTTETAPSAPQSGLRVPEAAAAKAVMVYSADPWNSLRSLRVGQLIRVEDQRRRTFCRATFRSVSENAISFAVGNEQITLRRPDIWQVSAVSNNRSGPATGAGVRTTPGIVAGPIPPLEMTRTDSCPTQLIYRSEWRGILSTPDRESVRCCQPYCSNHDPHVHDDVVSNSTATELGDFAERVYGRETTEIKTVRRERKPRDSRRSRRAAIALTTAPVPDPAVTEVPTQPVELENPTEQPQPETEVTEKSTPDSAEPPAAEEPTAPPPGEVSFQPAEQENSAEPAPTEAEVSERATQDSAEPPAAEEPTAPPTTEIEISLPEKSEESASERR